MQTSGPHQISRATPPRRSIRASAAVDRWREILGANL